MILSCAGAEIEPVGDLVRPDEMQFVVGHSGSNSWIAYTRLSAVAKTWVLTGSLDNFRATREHGFRVIGAKEGAAGWPSRSSPATASPST